MLLLPQSALTWCLAVQECSMYISWLPAVLRQWPEERGAMGQIIFRGPRSSGCYKVLHRILNKQKDFDLLLFNSRLKMGVCEGQPRSILPDHMGRVDYLGACINQAARYMDAGQLQSTRVQFELSTGGCGAVLRAYSHTVEGSLS